MPRITIDKLIYEGWGIGRDQDGRMLFIKKCAPGDILEVEITKEKKNYAESSITAINSPSPERTTPTCPHFDQCGGCDYQHLTYNYQLRTKEDIFAETLTRQKVDIMPEPIIVASNEHLQYRNNIRLFFMPYSQPQGLRAKTPGVEISYALYDHTENKLIPIDQCLLQSKKMIQVTQNILDCLNKSNANKMGLWQLHLREGKMTGEIMVEFITTSEVLPQKEELITLLSWVPGVTSVYHTIAPGKSLHTAKRRLLAGSLIIHDKIGPYSFQISPDSFFQTNTNGAKTLYDIVKQYAEITPSDIILDLYCGTGTIGIYLARMAKRVIGVESVQSAICDANDNARLNHVSNCEFICDKVESWLGKTSTSSLSPSIIVIDPPRNGLAPEIIDSISQLDFEKLIYVSCNPATFARDIVRFKEKGIALKKVQPVDMFPQTYHIECVGLLIKE